jgi:hypothetical protein
LAASVTEQIFAAKFSTKLSMDLNQYDFNVMFGSVQIEFFLQWQVQESRFVFGGENLRSSS